MDDESVLSRSAAEPDAVVRWGAGADDVADVRYGASDRPLLVMLHGGFWRPAYDRLHVRAMTQALAEAGWTVAAPEYRRVPGDPDATCDDVRTALSVIPDELRGRYDGRVVVLGHSAGGHLALWAAAAAPAPGLVGTLALAPVADLAAAEAEHLGSGAVGAFLGATAASRPDLDPTRLGPATGSVEIVHGEQDDVVPLSQAQSYAAAHPGAVLDAVPECGHFAVIDPASRAWPRVVAAVHRLCGPAPAREAGIGPQGT